MSHDMSECLTFLITPLPLAGGVGGEAFGFAPGKAWVCSVQSRLLLRANCDSLITMQRYNIGGARWWTLVDMDKTILKLLHFFWHIDTIVLYDVFHGLWR